MSKSVSDYLSGVEHLNSFHERIKNLIVSNTDAIGLMKRFSKENVFMHLDPPYVQSTRTSNTNYQIDMDDAQQDVFLNECINNNTKLLISGYDNDKYDILLKNVFNKTNFETNNRTETILVTFNIKYLDKKNNCINFAIGLITINVIKLYVSIYKK